MTDKVVLTHHLSCCGLALSLEHGLALGDVLGDALLGLPLHVLGVPHGGVLGPALHARGLPGGGRGLDCAVRAGGGGSQAQTSDQKK